MKIGFIGTGEIAGFMVAGLAGRGFEIVVSQRNPIASQRLADTYLEVRVADNQTIAAECDVVFLCLMADVARSVLPTLAFQPNQSIISVMADYPMAELQENCAPAVDIAITIPLSAIATGGSVLPVFPKSEALEKLFGASDRLIPVASERALNAHFGASALSAPLLDLMKTGADWLAQQTGDADLAEVYVSGVFAGFFRQMAAQNVRFEDLLDGLATEGGLNATLKTQMREAGAHDALQEGLENLAKRLKI